MTWETVLVASPSAIGSTPVASGSRVPPCPALAASRARRTAVTARVDVMPSGLSRMSQPWTGRPRRLRAIAIAAVGRLVPEIAGDRRFVQQAFDAVGAVEGRVGLE